MRYSLWVNVMEGKYIHCSQATNIELLKDLARSLVAACYIFDHVRNIKVWHRDVDGTEVSDDNLIKEAVTDNLIKEV